MNILKILGANAPLSGQTIAFRASATSTNTAGTIVAPSGIVAGDLLVLYDSAANNTTIPTAVIPSGFGSPAIINQTFSTNRRVIVSMKIANGTEAGATITGMSVNNTVNKILIVFSTNGATSSIAYDVDFQSTDGDPTAQTVTSASGSPPLVVLAFYRNTTGVSFSPTEDGSVVNGGQQGKYKIYNSSPADVTVDLGDAGTANMLMSFYIEVN